MVLHQAGEVLHCDETGVLWVQLENENRDRDGESVGQSSRAQDVSAMRRDFLISRSVELKCQFTPRGHATVQTAEMHTQRNNRHS